MLWLLFKKNVAFVIELLAKEELGHWEKEYGLYLPHMTIDVEIKVIVICHATEEAVWAPSGILGSKFQRLRKPSVKSWYHWAVYAKLEAKA